VRVSIDVAAALDAVAAGTAARDLESETLDFKTVARSRDDALSDLAEAAMCFANAGGGAIVVGVADRPGGAQAFVGCPLDEAVVRRRIFDMTDPHLTVSVGRLTRPEGEVLVIEVPESATLHSVRGRHTERIGTSCMQMAAGRIAQVMQDRAGDDWSAHTTAVPLTAVDPVAMSIARRFLEASVDPTRRGYARLSDPDLLRVLGVAATDGSLNRAGLLLLGTPDDKRELVAYSHRRTPTGALTANDSFTAPLVFALDRVFDMITARVERTSVDVGRGQQLQIEDLPAAAVREAVVNAAMHRDYRNPGRIVIEHAATRLAVTSPGPFMAGITPSNVLTAASRTRNPRLAEAIRKLGLAETAGTGVDRMYAAMARVGHNPPTYEADEASVRVTLSGGAPNAYLARYVATLPADVAEDADTMLVLLTLLGHRTITAAEMSTSLQKAPVEVQAVLDRLAAPPRDLIEPTRETARRSLPTYRLREAALTALGPAVTYRRRTMDSSDRKILALLRESGSINARMVRLLLDTDTPTTSRILGDLVERGLLSKTSQATRGPGVTYGPGPRTGTSSRRSASPATREAPKTDLQPDLFPDPGDAADSPPPAVPTSHD